MTTRLMPRLALVGLVLVAAVLVVHIGTKIVQAQPDRLETHLTFYWGVVDVGPDQTARLSVSNSLVCQGGSEQIRLAFADESGRFRSSSRATLRCGESAFLDFTPQSRVLEKVIGILQLSRGAAWEAAFAPPIMSFELLEGDRTVVVLTPTAPVRAGALFTQ